MLSLRKFPEMEPDEAYAEICSMVLVRCHAVAAACPVLSRVSDSENARCGSSDDRVSAGVAQPSARAEGRRAGAPNARRRRL